MRENVQTPLYLLRWDLAASVQFGYNRHYRG